MVDDIDDDKNVNFEELEKFLMDTIDELESRFKDGKNEDIDVKARLLVAICAKLWKEKDGWKQMYYDMTNRYNKHLDNDIAEYNRILGKRR